MKNLKLILLLAILINSIQVFGQDKTTNDTIKNISSKQLYNDLHKNEKNPLLVINGIAIGNNVEILSIIKPNDLKNIEILKDSNPVNLYGEKAKNGVVFVTLKNKKINTIEKLNKAYSLNDSNKKDELTISGIITNSNNIPISDVVISNLNKKESYKSDSKGNYFLNANKNDVVVYYLEGFESKTITIENETKINIILNKLAVSDKPVIMIKKPVIYLYPTQKTDINISLDFKGKLLTTFPKYDTNWTLTAYPDGRIFDKKTNRFYTSLFWDGAKKFPKEHYQYQSGFVIAKNNLTNFLIEKLKFMGLNHLETNDFIQYWLPILEKNETNFIHFYVNSDYDVISKNNVIPKPDTSIRIFMEFYGLDKPMEIPEQHIPKSERKGFTLVEWGGADVSEPVNELNSLKL